MKFNVTAALVILFSSTLLAQTSGMRTLKDRFKGEENVHSFKLGGIMARVVFKLVADDEEIKDAIQDIRSVDVISIPKEAFAEQHVSVKGYKKFLEEKGFVSLMDVRDKGDHISIYLAPESGKFERYLIVADEDAEVTVIELKGHIDPSKLSATKLTAANL